MSLEKRSYVVDGTLPLDIWIFIDESRNVWFKANEIGFALGYVRPRNAVMLNVLDANVLYWRTLGNNISFQTIDEVSNWQPDTIFVNEYGLYSLIFSSKKREALQFRHWMMSEVLPSIRQRGASIVSNQLNELRSEIEEKGREIEEKNTSISQLTTNVFNVCNRVLDQQPKVAVIPRRNCLQHQLRVYQTAPNTYKFIRCQKIHMSQALRRIDLPASELIFQLDFVPNGINILNRVKELMPRSEYRSYNNCVVTERDIGNLIQRVLDECGTTSDIREIQYSSLNISQQPSTSGSNLPAVMEF